MNKDYFIMRTKYFSPPNFNYNMLQKSLILECKSKKDIDKKIEKIHSDFIKIEN